jgi:hypothetical protein
MARTKQTARLKQAYDELSRKKIDESKNKKTADVLVESDKGPMDRKDYMNLVSSSSKIDKTKIDKTKSSAKEVRSSLMKKSSKAMRKKFWLN